MAAAAEEVADVEEAMAIGGGGGSGSSGGGVHLSWHLTEVKWPLAHGASGVAAVVTKRSFYQRGNVVVKAKRWTDKPIS